MKGKRQSMAAFKTGYISFSMNTLEGHEWLGFAPRIYRLLLPMSILNIFHIRHHRRYHHELKETITIEVWLFSVAPILVLTIFFFFSVFPLFSFNFGTAATSDYCRCFSGIFFLVFPEFVKILHSNVFFWFVLFSSFC